MDDNRSFILENSLAAVSAIPFECSIHATDGHECTIHVFNETECDSCRIRTLRPYRRLRYNEEAGIYTAISCCNENRVYFLNCHYCETGFTALNTKSGCGCNSSSLGEITDASIKVVGSETFIVASFEKSAYLFDMDGNRLTRLCKAECNEILTDFVTLEEDVFAIGTQNGKTNAVTVSDHGSIHSAILSSDVSLRMLIPVKCELYGLFGRGYIYNRIIKIYSNGCLRLPTARDFL